LASRSKSPRGRVDPFSQIADLGNLHLAGYLGMECQAVGLKQDRTELNDAQRSLAPSDDGVDTRTVSVVWADSAVAVAIESHRVAAVTALALARDEIHEWIVQCLLCRIRIHDGPDSSSGPGQPKTPGTCSHIHRRRHGLRRRVPRSMPVHARTLNREVWNVFHEMSAKALRMWITWGLLRQSPMA
jgi:hypothetical protein